MIDREQAKAQTAKNLIKAGVLKPEEQPDYIKALSYLSTDTLVCQLLVSHNLKEANHD